MLLLVTFASGVASAIAYDRYHGATHDTVPMQGHEAMHELVRDLDLDAAQQQAIAEIPPVQTSGD